MGRQTGIVPIIGDPNHTMAELPHGDLIADKLRKVLSDPNSSPEERAHAESFLSQFRSNGNTPHPDVINDPEVSLAQCEFDEEPKAVQPKPSGSWEPSDGTPGRAATPPTFRQIQTRTI